MIHLLAVLMTVTLVRVPGGDDPGRASIRARLLYDGSDWGIARISGMRPDHAADRLTVRSGGRRSIPAAFAMSAVLPGAGQAYNRQWVKAGVALALEAVAITAYAARHREGLDAQEAVEAFAHRDWSPARYAEWLTDYTAWLEITYGHTVTAPPPGIPTGIDFSRPASWSDAERLTVDRFFDQIRALERQVYHPETKASFSHQLPYFGEQQYYELIGKYFQFAPGWNDYAAWLDGSGGYTVAIDPEHTGPGGSKPNVSETFRRYAREHAEAQDILRQAGRISMLILVNHLVASIDAAVSAKLHNDRIDSQMGLTYGPGGRPQPVAVVRLRL